MERSAALASFRAAAIGAMAAMFASETVSAQRLDVIYEPTPPETVERMLNMANVGPSDRVIDLGSGDGRIAVAAGTRGARALGVDLDPKRIREANANARRAGVNDRVEFKQQDLFKTPLGDATVITLYLLPELNVRLRPSLLRLRPGTRVVSHRFAMGDWKADRTDASGGAVFLWIIPAQVAGRWRVNHGGESFPVALTQRFQEVGGSASVSGRTVPVREGRLNGNQIAFTIDVAGQPTRFSGVVSEKSMTAGAGSAAGGWSATRL